MLYSEMEWKWIYFTKEVERKQIIEDLDRSMKEKHMTLYGKIML